MEGQVQLRELKIQRPGIELYHIFGLGFKWSAQDFQVDSKAKVKWDYKGDIRDYIRDYINESKIV